MNYYDQAWQAALARGDLFLPNDLLQLKRLFEDVCKAAYEGDAKWRAEVLQKLQEHAGAMVGDAELDVEDANEEAAAATATV